MRNRIVDIIAIFAMPFVFLMVLWNAIKFSSGMIGYQLAREWRSRKAHYSKPDGADNDQG